MAIKDQCLICKRYSSKGICEKKGGIPMFDCSSCEEYEKRGIRLDKQNDNVQNPVPVMPKPNPNPVSPTPAPVPSPVTPTPVGNGASSVKNRMFSNVFSFSGRIRRLEYGITYLLYVLYSLPMRVLDENQISGGFAMVWLMLLIPVLWILYAQGAKRCHDLGHSGWWQLIPFYWLWMIFDEGDGCCSNKYGHSAK